MFVVTMLSIYREAALAQMIEAENIISRGLELRESAMGLLDRAAELAFAYAKEEAEQAGIVPPGKEEEPIDW